MAVRPNTNGYLSRATNLPVNATNWTICARFMASAAMPAAYPTLFGLSVDTDNWMLVDLPTNTLNLEIERQGPAVSFAYAVSSIFTLSAGTWYFLAMKATGAGTADILHGAFGAETLTKISGVTIPDLTWTTIWHLNDNFGGIWENGRSHSLKMWHAALSDAEILAESKSAPPVRTSNIDSYLTLFDATDAGDDESGNNRDWTVTGTLATVPFAPVGPVGPFAVSAAIQNPTATSIQPVAMGGAVALAAAALNPAITYPVTLGGPVALAAAVQQPAAASVQPVTLGGAVALAAAVQQPAVSQLLAPSVVAATATPLQPAAASMQPVSMAGALQLALTVQEPALSTSGIVVSGPAPIVLSVPSPAVRDPYPHGFARRTRGDFRRAKFG